MMEARAAVATRGLALWKCSAMSPDGSGAFPRFKSQMTSSTIWGETVSRILMGFSV